MSTLNNNIAKAADYLKPFAKGVMNHIAGKQQPAISGKTFEIMTPVDQSHLAHVASSDAKDIDLAAKAAKAAFPAWAALDGTKRRDLLHAIADGIEKRAEEIAFVECMDTGQALRFMSKAAIRGAENFRFFADKAPDARDGKTLRAPGQVNMTGRNPLGAGWRHHAVEYAVYVIDMEDRAGTWRRVALLCISPRNSPPFQPPFWFRSQKKRAFPLACGTPCMVLVKRQARH